MGITGLIPFLKDASKHTNISDFSGGTVAIDTYCWLHKGAFSCADKIIMGQPTDAYVKYCMKFVSMLLSKNIKPILVFDGRHLPAKAETEVKRRESRDTNRKRAAELIKMGKDYEGKNLLRRSLDVSHKMALEVIKECQAHNVDCIVAPYEADAQLAYLNISGIADVVITEDSDLTLFGCKKIFFKMDFYGNGVLVEQEKLHLTMKLKPSDFNMDKFRYMCILSGCDYLASLPGIGLNKACKFIVKNSDDDIYNALQRLASTLNMKSLVVTKEYRDNFMRALVTFKHQLVYCPLQRKQVRLHPPPPNVTDEQLIHAGSEVDNDLAWELALGNCDPFSYKKLHEFDPDKAQRKLTNSWSEIPVAKHNSIWSKTNKIQVNKITTTPKKESPKRLLTRIASTKGQIVVMKTDSIKKEITPKKRSFEECDMSIDEIVQMYKRPTEDKPTLESVVKEEPKEQMSPVLCRRSNPFKKLNDSNETSPSLLYKTRRRITLKSRFKPTVIDHTAIDQSEFFSGSSNVKIEKEEELPDSAESMVTHADLENYKENVALVERVIIPETEDFEDDTIPVEQNNIDSGYKENSDQKNCNSSAMECDISITEKEPLHLVDNNLVKTNKISAMEFSSEATKKENQGVFYENKNCDLEFTVTREIFSEFKSSSFAFASPNKFRRDRSASQRSQNSSLSMQRKSSGIVKNNSKKTTIQGQQSILSMFGNMKK